METDLRFFNVVDSTNTVVQSMADEGAREGTCVVALAQTKGQGRSGRSFFSPEGGNLYMSLLLRPKSDVITSKITIAAAVSVSEVLDEVFDITTGIKWVNDIIYNDRKICGIVATARNVGRADMYVILGIGINIYAHDVPDDILGVYGSILNRPCDLSVDEERSFVEDLAQKLINRFAKYYEDPGSPSLIKGYQKRSCVTGREVLYMSGSDTKPAKVIGIDDDGGIILDMNGTVGTFRDGEIRIKMQKM